MGNPPRHREYSGSDWFRSGGRYFDYAVVSVSMVLFGLMIYRTPLLRWEFMVLLLIVAFEANDLVVGLTHWFLDKYVSYDHRILGNLARTFREHHPHPERVTEHGYFETSNDALPAALVVQIVTLAFVRSPALSWFIIFFAFIGANSAVIHRWAHVERPPRMVLLLQRCGVFVSKEHHFQHHLSLRSHYCAISGHFNYPMNYLDVWGKLEQVIERLTGIAPIRQEPFHTALPREDAA